MMPTYLYCIVAPAAAPPPEGTAGLDGAPVRRVADAWVSDVDTRHVRATVDRVRRHDAVVAAALSTGMTPLPARFGQTFATDDDCVTTVSERAATLRVALDHVAGAVEMTVLLRLAADPAEVAGRPPAGVSGREYLEGLARRAKRVRAMNDALAEAARVLTAAVAPFVRGTAVQPATAERPVVAVAHLVDKGAVVRYRAQVDAASGGLADGIVVRTAGPGAPYSFGARV